MQNKLWQLACYADQPKKEGKNQKEGSGAIKVGRGNEAFVQKVRDEERAKTAIAETK